MLNDILARYLKVYPKEAGNFKLLQRQVKADEALNDRRNFTGHITGSAIILSPDKKRILLIHHKAYDQWQQPGGHWEEDEPNPLKAAEREGREETGLKLNKYLPIDHTHPLVPFNIDSHRVPARPAKKEPPHYHHDFSYVFITKDIKPSHQTLEVFAAGWFTLDYPKTKLVRDVIAKLKIAGLSA